MSDNILLGFLHPILGNYRITSSNNVGFKCPFGSSYHKCQKQGKYKLEVNTVTNSQGENFWHCWVCGAKGKTIRSLLKALDIPKEKIDYIQSYIKKEHPGNHKETKNLPYVTLPKEFKPLWGKGQGFEYTQARKYCRGRGVTTSDMIKYNIGYCEQGKYAGSIIVPSYDKNGTINYFLARSYRPGSRSFNAPICDKDSIIGFEFFINWNTPVILCEGPFDAIAIKRNAIPLFGKTLPSALMKRLIMPDVRTIYLALDQEVLSLAIKYAEELINMGKEVYVINLSEKDPSELGFEKFTQLLHTAQPFEFTDLLINKIQLI